MGSQDFLNASVEQLFFRAKQPNNLPPLSANHLHFQLSPTINPSLNLNHQYTNMKRKIYISGKISGLHYPDVVDKFNKAEQSILFSGDVPVNPIHISPYGPNKEWEDYMIDCIKALFDCEAICMLPCWKDSKGARVEHAIAKELRLEIIYD